jgi:hypothetical protein
MHRPVIILAAVLGLLAPPGLSWTQAVRVWKTDLRIRSFDLLASGQGSVQATVGIVAEGDDGARAVRLEFLLPVSVGLIRAPAACKTSPASVGSLAARVTCELGDLPGRNPREVVLLTSAPPAGSGARFAVMVLSDTPDVTPSNNFAERAAP